MRHTIASSSSSSSSAGPRAADPRLQLLRRIEAFAPHARPAILALSDRSAALRDLAASFPALLFALATGYGTIAERRAATRAIEQGRPLREAADALRLPWWLRKLPAQAFQAPFALLPREPGLVTRLQSLIPPQPGIAAIWLDRVLVAYHTGNPELALWVAQNYRASTPAATSDTFLRILAWAWHAQRPGLRGEHLLLRRWTPQIGVRRAATEAALWRERITLDLLLGEGITDPWLANGHANGYDFVALRSADDFFAEASAMDNCLDRYADRLSRAPIRIFSIRRDGRPIADVEIAVHDREPGLPAVTQLRTARNRRAPFDIWQATYAWLGGQPLRPGTPGLRLAVGRAQAKRRLERFWQPFLDALPDHARAAFADATPPRAPRTPNASPPPPRARRGSSGSSCA